MTPQERHNRKQQLEAKARRQKVVALRRQGYTVIQLAGLLGVTRQRVYAILRAER